MSSSIDVTCNKSMSLNPQCFHGPTLLFCRRGDKDSEYFACSACRDRKDCSFYSKVSDDSSRQSERAILERKEFLSTISSTELRKSLLKLPFDRRGYCHTCSKLFDNQNEKHESCNKIIGLSTRKLCYPTEICIPKENNKMEAQYLFSGETSAFVVDAVKKLSVERVICIGTPRLHELFINETKLTSLLLDIDPKYHYFNSPQQFIWYNMFNNFTMDESRRQDLETFLQKRGKMAVLLDPPFGGRVEPIAYTLREIKEQHQMIFKDNGDAAILWFFPYFMEKHICDSMPEMHMLDYQVNYENHDVFSDVGKRKRKAGSPVRIFTNVKKALFDLSTISGYKFCDECGHWVSQTNRHCKKCNACTSKNGQRYVHCVRCKCCVKPTYEHCVTCQRCQLPKHVCGQFTPDSSCFHCHQHGHKRSKCPQLIAGSSKPKRRRKHK